jgi:hypothetical protein
VLNSANLQIFEYPLFTLLRALVPYHLETEGLLTTTALCIAGEPVENTVVLQTIANDGVYELWETVLVHYVDLENNVEQTID